MNIAIIPARGGSKRIPRKNIRDFCGKPIIAYSIESAIKSELFDRVIVSTDDEEISDVARQYGADVPFLRPDRYSDDFATTADVMAHAVSWLQEKQYELNGVCCIYATVPFLKPEEIAYALTLFKNNKWNFVFSATDFSYPIQRSFKKIDTGSVDMLFPEHFNTRSQDLDKTYHDIGYFYWGTPEAWKEKKRVFSSQSTFVHIPPYRAVDIDNEEDWIRAELLFKVLNSIGNKNEKSTGCCSSP
ncbi:MAG: pseudaminic acid cytidylyltransferase [Desulfobacterales bacterium]|nr:pseudaminic acid cytidylyltransferase [Desulfobacterales bacterium]